MADGRQRRPCSAAGGRLGLRCNFFKARYSAQRRCRALGRTERKQMLSGDPHQRPTGLLPRSSFAALLVAFCAMLLVLCSSAGAEGTATAPVESSVVTAAAPASTDTAPATT